MTEADVANMALALLVEAPITALTDDNTAARLCNLHFDQTRRAELAAHTWHFALVTEELTGTEVDDGLWEYTSTTEILRLIPLTYDNEIAGVPITWEQRGGKLYSDQESPRGVRYIADVEDPTDWPPLFVDVVAAALALKIAHPLTHKASMIQIAQNAYDRALYRAQLANAITRSGALTTADWSLQRGDTRYWRA